MTVSIDLGGYTLTSRLNSGIVNRGTITSLTNGNIVGGKGYGVVNYGNIGELNVNVQVTMEVAGGYGAIYVASGTIDKISGGSYKGHPETYDSAAMSGSFGLYISSSGVVKEISGGYFAGTLTAFRNYNQNGIELVSGGFFDCPYMDANNVTFTDTLYIMFLTFYIP